jgi:hypothetical protein
MHWTKDGAKLRHSARIGQIASICLVVAVAGAFATTSCSSSMEQASVRYREQHQNRGHLLHDNTVERLQGCAEEFAEQVNENSVRVWATVQVDREGRIYKVTVDGVPETASDLAACTRVTLQDMTVPPLPLRSESKQETTSVPTKPKGNELAHPAVLVEVAILLGEFAAQHGAKTILYAVTIQVVAAVAVEGYKNLSEECRRAKEACIVSCTNSTLPTGWLHGVPFHKCMRDCMEAAGCYHGQ